MKIETKFNPGDYVVAVHGNRIVLAVVSRIEITAGTGEKDRLTTYHLNERVQGTAFERYERLVFETVDQAAAYLKENAV